MKKEASQNPIRNIKSSGFRYYIKSFDESVFKSKMVAYTAELPNEDVAQIFVDNLEESIREIYQKIKNKKEMIFTEKEICCSSSNIETI